MSDAEAAWTQWWYEKWPDGTEPKSKKAFLAGFAAGGVAALEQAAKDLPAQFDPDFHNHDWLRDRAQQLRDQA